MLVNDSMKYASHLQNGAADAARPEMLLPCSVFSVLPQNGPKLSVHARTALDREGKTRLHCASGKSLTKRRRRHGVSWAALRFFWLVGLWALVSGHVRLMGACTVTTAMKPRVVSWGFFLAF